MAIQQAFFLVLVFFTAFAFCIPLGPGSLCVVQAAARQRFGISLSMGAGISLGSAMWASLAFQGHAQLSFQMGKIPLRGILMLGLAAFCLWWGISHIRSANGSRTKEPGPPQKKGRKRWGFLKGLTLSLTNPSGLASWTVILDLFKRMHLGVPPSTAWSAAFYFTVFSGTALFESILALIAQSPRGIFKNPSRSRSISHFTAWILILIALYWLAQGIALFTRLFPG